MRDNLTHIASLLAVSTDVHVRRELIRDAIGALSALVADMPAADRDAIAVRLFRAAAEA